MIVALVVALGIIAFVYLVDKDSRAETSLWGNRLRVLSAIILVCFVGAFFFFPKPFEALAHWVAAVLIFVSIGAVVFINAYLVSNQDKQDTATRERFHRCYRLIAWMMVGSLIGALIVAAMRRFSHLQDDAWSIPVFALETALLLEFAVFWALQTVELWDYADRNTLIPEEKQADDGSSVIRGRRFTRVVRRGPAVCPASSPAAATPSNPSCGCRSSGKLNFALRPPAAAYFCWNSLLVDSVMVSRYWALNCVPKFPSLASRSESAPLPQ